MALWSTLAHILFVGHSLVGPDLPPLLEAALEHRVPPVRVEAQIINGAPLVWNWDHAGAAEGVNGRDLLATGRVSDLILTEAQPIADHLAANASKDWLARWQDLGQAANPEQRLWLYETWPAMGAGGVAAWRAKVEADAPLWRELAGDRAQIIPAGQALAHLSEAVEAGAVPDLPRFEAVFSDRHHLSDKGRYFVAMVHVAALTGYSPEGLPAKLLRVWPSKDAVMSEAEAQALQRIAWEAVTREREDRQSHGAKASIPEMPIMAEEVEGEAAVPPSSVAKPLALEMPDFPKNRNHNLGLSLTSVHDWSVEQPFLDLMKTARPWVGHLSGQWGGWTEDDLRAAGALDGSGWLTFLPDNLEGVSTLILTDLPEEAGGVAGRYLLSYKGKGRIDLSGRAENVTSRAGGIAFDYRPGEGSVILTIRAVDRDDPLREITVVREDRAAALAAGEIFNPDFLKRFEGVRVLRFMDWLQTNGSVLVRAEDRPRPEDYTWARHGVPLEVVVALSNRLGAEAWINIPHLADDGFVAAAAELVARDLDPELRLWVEFSNEVWNWQFSQAHWAEAEGKRLWGRENTWVSAYALRAAEVMDIWARHLPPERLQRVLAVQTGWKGLEAEMLVPSVLHGTEKENLARHFDAYAITGYFSGRLGTPAQRQRIEAWLGESRLAAEAAAEAEGLQGGAARAYTAKHRYDHAFDLAARELAEGAISGDAGDTLLYLTEDLFPYHAAVARSHGLDLVMYEGGSHVVGEGELVEDRELTDFLTAFNFSPQMGDLYRRLLATWAKTSDAPFMNFGSAYVPSKWGSWGGLRHLWDDNPRWQALTRGCPTC